MRICIIFNGEDRGERKEKGGGGGGTVCFGLKWSGGGLVVIDGEVFFLEFNENWKWKTQLSI